MSDLVRCDRTNQHIVIKMFSGGGLFDAAVAAASVQVFHLGIPRTPLALFVLPFAIIRFFWLLVGIRPAIIVGWLYYGALFASLGCLLGRPVVWSFHAADFDLGRSFRSPTRAAVRLCRLLFDHVPILYIHYCSRASQAHHERLGFTFSRSLVIENGVDVGQLTSAGSPLTLTALLGKPMPAHSKLISCIARFEPQKDHRTLLAAAARLKGAGRRFSIIFAGRGCNRENPKLQALLEEFDLHGEVIPLGIVSDVPRLIRHSDAVVLSSCEGEALPMVLLEALLVGKPVVATDVGSVSGVVGMFGLVVPPRNAEALSEAIEQVVWVNPSYTRLAAEEAPAYINKWYSLDAAVKRWNDFFSSILVASANRGDC